MYANSNKTQPSRTKDTHAIMRYRTGSRADVEKEVRDGKVVIGRLRVFSHHTSGLAFVGSPDFPCDVVVSGQGSMQGALHGDIVAVQLFPENQWETLKENEKMQGKHAEESEEDGQHKVPMPTTLPDGRDIKSWMHDTSRGTDSALEVKLAREMSAPKVFDWGCKKPCGVVRIVLARSRSLFVAARLVDDALGQSLEVQSNRYYQFKSYDPLLPHIAVFGRDIPVSFHATLGNCFFLLRLLTQDNGDFLWTGYKYPTGKIVRVLGTLDSIATHSFALCSASKISTDDFSEEAYACVLDEFTVPDKLGLHRMGRRDLREEEFVCSIDPSTARDLDDALSITITPGGYRVGVHIADVSYFVPAGSALDEEARERSTSVYLVEKVIPMLPRKLSEDYCSLNPGSDKFAFSSIFHLDHHGKVASEWFGQSVIRNRCRLTYEEAQRIIDGDEDVLDTLDYGGSERTPDLKARVALSVRTLFELASKMRMKSLEQGRLTIGNTKIRFHFEDISNPSFPLGFGISRQIEANWLVEELMLLANNRVAEKIVEYMPDQALLRRHEPPERKKFTALKHSLELIGLEINGGASKSLQRTLDTAKGSEHYDDICVALKYALQPAKYFVNSSEEENAYRSHYALAMLWYTHFTSPIRRYCDIIVHRQLLCALEIESIVKGASRHKVAASEKINVDQLATKNFFYTASEVEQIVERANEKKKQARKVSEASLGLFFCNYLSCVRRLWDENADIRDQPFTPRVEAVVVQIAEKGNFFTLFAKEVVQEVKINLMSKEQLFIYEGKVDAGAGGPENNATEAGEKAPGTEWGRHKNENEMNKKRKEKSNEKKTDTSGKLLLRWGPHPVTGEEVEEELRLMTVLTAVLAIKRDEGYDQPSMIVDPPWMRKTERIKIPTTLLQK